MKKYKYLLTILLLNILFISCKKNVSFDNETKLLLNNVSKSINDKKCIIYKLSTKIKDFSESDTLSLKSIYFITYDDITNDLHYYILNKNSENIYGFQKYDGENIYVYEYNPSLKESYKLVQNIKKPNRDDIFNSFLSNGGLMELYRKDSAFYHIDQYIHDDSKIEKFYSKDGTLENKKVKIFCTEFKNSDPVKYNDIIDNAKAKYYIDPQTYLPIAFYEIAEYNGLSSYIFKKIEYLEMDEKYLTANIKDNVYDRNILNLMMYYLKNDSILDYNYFTKNKNERLFINKNINKSNVLFQDFKLNNNTTFNIKSANDKLIIFDFWYYSCLPCLEMLPILSEIQQEYKDKVIIIGLNDRDDFTNVNKIFKHKNISYFSTYASSINYKEVYGIKSFPTLYISNNEGKILYKSEGTMSKESLKKLIDKLIRQNQR